MPRSILIDLFIYNECHPSVINQMKLIGYSDHDYHQLLGKRIRHLFCKDAHTHTYTNADIDHASGKE